MAHSIIKPLMAAMTVILLSVVGVAAGPSRLSVDFSSSLIVSPDSTPASVLNRLQALLGDMQQDGVNTLCTGRLETHICSGTSTTAGSVSLRFPLLHMGVEVEAADSCTLCAPTAPAATGAASASSAAELCSCTAPGGKTRCTCTAKLTGEQYFAAKWYGLELARVAVEAVGETKTIDGGIHANFNSTIRLRKSTVVVTKGAGGAEGIHDFELDESHLDLLEGSELRIEDDGDLEVEDAGSLWLSGRSKLIAKQASNIQTQLSHILVEGGSSIIVEANSEWNVTQEFDFTPVQAAAVCNKPFEPNPSAQGCYDSKDGCAARLASKQLSGPEHQALGMLKYPPALDRWGRQAFDYADDNVYDDYYDADYTEIQLESGTCLGADVCGESAAKSSGEVQAGRKRALLGDAFQPFLSSTFSKPSEPTTAAAEPSPAAPAAGSVAAAQSIAATKAVDATAHAVAPAPMTSGTVSATNSNDSTNTDKGNADSDNADSDSTNSHAEEGKDDASDNADSDSNDSNTAQSDGDGAAAATSSSSGVVNDGDDEGTTTSEINAKDTLDGTGYDPEWGEGPYGESLCDAPPFKAFNYYGLVVRDNSHIRIASQSSWSLFDQSRVFITDSTLTLEDGARLNLYNSTIVLINSVLEIKGSSEIHLERFSGLHLFQSKVLGDNALYAVPAGSTWNGQPWLQRGDYRASPGGGLPVGMGAQPGTQLGSFPLRMFGFDLDARLMPAAGCNCKKARGIVLQAAEAVVNVPDSGSLLDGLI